MAVAPQWRTRRRLMTSDRLRELLRQARKSVRVWRGLANERAQSLRAYYDSINARLNRLEAQAVGIQQQATSVQKEKRLFVFWDDVPDEFRIHTESLRCDLAGATRCAAAPRDSGFRRRCENEVAGSSPLCGTHAKMLDGKCSRRGSIGVSVNPPGLSKWQESMRGRYQQ